MEANIIRKTAGVGCGGLHWAKNRTHPWRGLVWFKEQGWCCQEEQKITFFFYCSGTRAVLRTLSVSSRNASLRGCCSSAMAILFVLVVTKTSFRRCKLASVSEEGQFLQVRSHTNCDRNQKSSRKGGKGKRNMKNLARVLYEHLSS